MGGGDLKGVITGTAGEGLDIGDVGKGVEVIGARFRELQCVVAITTIDIERVALSGRDLDGVITGTTGNGLNASEQFTER